MICLCNFIKPQKSRRITKFVNSYNGRKWSRVGAIGVGAALGIALIKRTSLGV